VAPPTTVVRFDGEENDLRGEAERRLVDGADEEKVRRSGGKNAKEEKKKKKRKMAAAKEEKELPPNPHVRKSGKKGVLYQENQEADGANGKLPRVAGPLAGFLASFEKRRRLLVSRPDASSFTH